jgi:hypothetical protein
METLEEIQEFVSGTAKKFDCEILTEASSISMHDNFVQIRIQVEGKTTLDCYECICTILQRYYYGAILRLPPKALAERDFETDNVHYRGVLRFVFNTAEQPPMLYMALGSE